MQHLTFIWTPDAGGEGWLFKRQYCDNQDYFSHDHILNMIIILVFNSLSSYSCVLFHMPLSG